MKLTCPNCGHDSDVKRPALVSAGKAMAAKITPDQRKAWGAKGGKANRKEPKLY